MRDHVAINIKTGEIVDLSDLRCLALDRYTRMTLDSQDAKARSKFARKFGRIIQRDGSTP